MKIQINGETAEEREGATVSELLRSQNAEMAEYVTVQINEEFVPKEEFDTRTVKDGDSVEFLYFMGGGEDVQ